MTQASEPRELLSRRAIVGIVLAVLAGHGAVLVVLAQRTGTTVDEPTLIAGGRKILEEGWADLWTRFQGPLPLYANQLLTQGREVSPPSAETLFLGRLGLLPFALLLGGIVFLWARAAFGLAGGFLALALWAAHPLLLGYGALLAVDIAHSALVLLALFAAWHHLRRPGPLRTLGCGLTLGAALATKYLAVLFVPVVAGAVALAGWRGAERSLPMRLARASARTVALGAIALLSLHACYGFRAGFAPRDAQSYRSELVRSWIGRPLTGHALATLPAPFLAGVDFQLEVSRTPHETFFDGRYARGHAGYYLGALGWKTPEFALVLFAGAGLFAALRWRHSAPDARRTWIVLGCAIALPLAYLSFFNRIQIGVRYALPLCPMAALLSGSLLAPIGPRRRVALLAAPALALLAGAAEIATRWPYLLGYFNRTSGGPELAWRRFDDSNCDWGQLARRGLETLRTEHGEFAVLSAADGPRFGRCALYVGDLSPRDPQHPERAYTWLAPFVPIAHVGAAWFLFDPTPAAFAAAAAASPDPRVRRDLALAWAGAGELDRAEELGADQLGAEEREALATLRATNTPAAGDPLARALARSEAWSRLRRHDLASAELTDPALASLPAARAALVEALVGQARRGEAIELLERSPELLGQERYAVLLFHLYSEVARFADAVAWMEPRLDAISPELRPHVEKLLEVQRGLAETALRYRPR